MKTLLGNQSGQLTFDFMIAITISLGLFILFFAMTYTFTTVEVAQYIAYSAARAQAGSNTTPDVQAANAIAKIQYLTANPASPLSQTFSNSWFQFSAKGATTYLGAGLASSGSMTALSSGTSANYENVFTGVSIKFVSTIFNYRVPFISTSSGATDDEGGFSTNINAVMIREPAVSECKHFWTNRPTALKSLKSAADGQTIPVDTYTPMEDNGC